MSDYTKRQKIRQLEAQRDKLKIKKKQVADELKVVATKLKTERSK